MYRLYLLLSGCRYGHWLSHFPLCLIKIHIQTPHYPDPAAPDGKRNYGNVGVPFARPPSLTPSHAGKATRDAYGADIIIQQQQQISK